MAHINKKINTPLSDRAVKELKIGDRVLITGSIFTARDAAHSRLLTLINEGKSLPFDLNGQIIYYAGPAPARPGYIIGPVGPTTSGRMDVYTPKLLEYGLKGMIGKGSRSKEVIDALKKYKGVYFAAIGGAAALIMKKIKKVEVIAYEDLGTEAIRRLDVEDFEAIVVNDIYGNDLYKEGTKRYKIAS